MSEAPDIAPENVEQVAEAVEQVVEGLGRIKMQYAALGAIFGAAAASITTYYLLDRKLAAKYELIAEQEIAEMRRHYHNKQTALDNTKGKPELEEIVREQGYSSVETSSPTPPMAVQPPAEIVEPDDEDEEDEDEDGAFRNITEGLPEDITERRAEAVRRDPQLRNVFEEHGDPVPEDHWDYTRERAKRSPDTPYIIHVDERGEFETYTEVTLTYYEKDDVLCNERDEVVPDPEREGLVGENSLDRFGHGSGDPTVVYVRNDSLQIVFEIIKSPNAYAEEVHGLQHSDVPRRRQRRRFDDESPSG